MKRSIILGWIRIVLGLFVFSFGVHLTIFANIGLAPWDCLGMGMSYHLPLNYGLSMTLMAVLILGIDLLMKEKIGFGTIIDALLTGNFVQMFNSLNPLPMEHSLWLGILIMLLGFVFMISTFGAGLVMQLVYSLIRFEPRTMKHRSVPEVMQILMDTKED